MRRPEVRTSWAWIGRGLHWYFSAEQASESVAHTTDALLVGVETESVVHTTDALISASDTQTHTTDALIQDGATVVHTTDAVLHDSNTLTVIYAINQSGSVAGTIYMIDPADYSVLDSWAKPVGIAGNLRSIAWDPRDSTLWMGSSSGSFLYKIDPHSMAVTGSVAISTDLVDALQWDGTDLWVGNSNSDVVMRVDPDTGTIADTYDVPPGSGSRFVPDLTFDGTSLWFNESAADVLYEIDPSDFSTVNSYSSPSVQEYAILFDGTYLRLGGPGEDIIFHVDPTDGSTVATDSSPVTDLRSWALGEHQLAVNVNIGHTTDAFIGVVSAGTVVHTTDALLAGEVPISGTITIRPTVTGTLTFLPDPGLVNEGPPGSDAGANTGGGGAGGGGGGTGGGDPGGGDGLPQQGGNAGGSAVGRNLFGLRNYRKPITIIKRNDAS